MIKRTHLSSRRTLAAVALSILFAPASLAIAQPAQPPRDPGVPPPPPPPAARDDDRRRDPPTIVVTGRGESTAAPDRAVVRLGAVAEAKQAKAAQDQVNQVMHKAIDALKNAGIAERDIQTSDLSISPVYSDFQPPIPMPGREGEVAQQQPAEPRITGYRASNVLEVRVNDIAKVGAVVDAGIEAGANQLQGVTFELKDDAKARADALREAVDDARADAETLAAALGVQLGPIDEAMTAHADVFPPRPMMMHRMAMAAEMATPVQPGEVRVNATVTLRYRISGAGNPRRAEAGQQQPQPQQQQQHRPRGGGDRDRQTNPPETP